MKLLDMFSRLFNKRIYDRVFEKYKQEHDCDDFKTLIYLLWRQTELPFEYIEKKFRYLLKSSHKRKWAVFEKYVFFLFLHGDLLDNLGSVFQKYLKGYNYWTPETKLRYISFLLMKENIELAKKQLLVYVEKQGTFLIEEFLTVANLAYNNGIRSEKIDRSAEIYRKFVINREMFKKLIQNKKVALVGNGPQEIGSNNGEKINAYDTVIRFNKYELNEEFSKDYGTKTAIWANGTGGLSLEKKGYFEYFLYLPDINSEFISNRMLSNFDSIFTIDIFRLRKEIYEKTKCYCPSNGLHLICMVKKLNPEFYVNDCFGFSFKDYREDPLYPHYFGPADCQDADHNIHNKELESKWMRRILAINAQIS